MEFAGLAMSAAGLVPITFQLINVSTTFYSDIASFGKDSQTLSLKFALLSRRYDSLQKLLFDKNKFHFISGTLFEELPVTDQRIVFTMLQELPRLLYKHYLAENGYKIQLQLEQPAVTAGSRTSSTIVLSATEQKLLFEAGEAPEGPKVSSKFSLSHIWWAARGKKKAERLNAAFEDWLVGIRQILEDAWWPLSFFDKYVNMYTLENDSDAKDIGISQPASLRKLLLDDAEVSSDIDWSRRSLAVQSLDNPRRGLATIEDRKVLLEILPYEPDKDGFLPATLQKRFATIANLLHGQQDLDLKVLNCLAYRNCTYPRSEFQLIFNIPSHSKPIPISLSSKITAKLKIKPSLGERLALCHQLAQSLSKMHSIGWIHRGLRSSNILYFDKESTTSTSVCDTEELSSYLSDARISGFEASRLESDFSTGPYDDDIHQNIYRHPDRWGIPTKTFTKYHDIYALGVIFLEIGLWESALTMGGNDFRKKKASEEIHAKAVAKELFRQADLRLGHRCGERFRGVVIRCLGGDFGVDERTETKLDTHLQARFRELVVDQLADLKDAV